MGRIGGRVSEIANDGEGVAALALVPVLGNVIPIRPPTREESAVAWFRAHVVRPLNIGLVFDPATVARAAEWPATSTVAIEIREIVRLVKAPLRQWDSLLSSARGALARETAERNRGTPASGEEWRAHLLADDNGRPRPSLGNACAFLEHTHAHRLTFDEMVVAPMLDGKALEDADVTQIRVDIEHTEGVEIGKEMASDAILRVARQNSAHPVKAYLRSLVHDGVKRIGTVASEYLGATDALSNVMVARTLIAAVARALEPGCQLDSCLVLVGDEGLRKSTFFRTIAGMWFGDSAVDIGDRKGVMTMKAAWLYEWPEVERMMLKKAESEIKAFVTQRDDKFIPMYGRGVTTSLRSTIVVGTTNEDRFLTSSTGSRRWWIVTVTKKIDVVRLTAERDQILAEAVAEYDARTAAKEAGVHADVNPHRWHLNEEEEAARKVRNEDYQTVSADEQTVGSWLDGGSLVCSVCKGSGDGFGHDATGGARPCSACKGEKRITREPFAKDAEGREYVTIVDVLAGPMIPSKEQTPAATQRAAFTVRRLGWKSGKRFRVGGRNSNKVTPYYPPEGHSAEAPAVIPVAAPADAQRVAAGICGACGKPDGKGPDRCPGCHLCKGCMDTPLGMWGACSCASGAG